MRHHAGAVRPNDSSRDTTFEEREGSTIVALQAVPHGASDEECRVFEGMFASMEQGYGGTFTQLGNYLAKP
jgi:hypothetical protein